MNKKVLLGVASMLFLGASAVVWHQQTNLGDFKLEKSIGEENEGGKNKAEKIKEALEWRLDRLKDENGNYDPQYYYNALAQANALKKNNSSRSLALDWQELGPDNIGGRTRAILVDKRDPQRKTLYAGGVGGGLWKSTNAGDSWKKLQGINEWNSISCIAQDKNGLIYYGTGEGHATPDGNKWGSSGVVGNGIFTLDANDNPVSLTSTQTSVLNVSDGWSCVNRIAIDPNDATHIFAATIGGLRESNDAGNTWTLIGSATKPIGGLTSGYTDAGDVKFSADGNYVFASVGTAGASSGVKFIRSVNSGGDFDFVPYSNFPAYTGAPGRIEIAIAPSNSEVVYTCVSSNYGNFDGVYKSSDHGASWTKIGAKGAALNIFGDNNQGYYDNVIAVNPFDEDKVYAGGTQIYTYTSLSGWKLASIYFGDPSNFYWVHADDHAIVFNDLNKNEMYIGCDGGIFKSTDAFDAFPTPTYRSRNNGYAVTQNYSVAAGLNGEVIGGAQDNGTNYVNFNGNTSLAGKSIRGGDGVFTEISHLDQNIFIAGVYNGAVQRSNNKGSTYADLFDAVIDPKGTGDPSVCGSAGNNSQFITPFWLCETKKATNSSDSVTFIADKSYNSGDQVNVLSKTKYLFQENLPIALDSGDKVKFVDRVKSRLYFQTSCGLWMTPDIQDFSSTPRWFKVSSNVGNPQSLTASATGDTIYVGNASGIVTQITGMNRLIQIDTATTGQSTDLITSPTQIKSWTVSGGRNISGISIDLNNPNHVICVSAGFSNSNATPHVFKTTNGGTTWTAITGPAGSKLPNMPVYDCVIDAKNADNYIIGSELGIFTSDDGGATWAEANDGMGKLPVYRLRQQAYLSDDCYSLYAGTHGRGMWRSTTLTTGGCQVNALGIKDPKNNSSIVDLLVYPNPTANNAKVVLNIDKAATNITIRIIDIPGKLVKELSYKNVDAGKTTFDLDLSNLSNGNYIVSTTINQSNTISKLLVVSK